MSPLKPGTLCFDKTTYRLVEIFHVDTSVIPPRFRVREFSSDGKHTIGMKVVGETDLLVVPIDRLHGSRADHPSISAEPIDLRAIAVHNPIADLLRGIPGGSVVTLTIETLLERDK